MLILVIIGYVITLAAGIVLIVDAFKNGGVLHGLLTIFLPFYGLYWLIFRMKENRGLVVGGWVVGFLFMIVPAIPTYMKASSAMSAANSSANRDVCSLLTADQVSTELHESFDLGEKDTSEGHPACNYRDSATATHKLVVVSLSCSPSKMSGLPLGENDSQVPGIGDQAVLFKGTLIARKGTNCLSMGVDGVPSEKTIEGRKHLMQTVLATLQ